MLSILSLSLSLSLHNQPKYSSMKFRPCIDLHNGIVKQIVGSTLVDNSDQAQTNFSTSTPASHFARMYQQDNLTGGHVIMLGPNNEQAVSNNNTKMT
jgi:phosphoribosylformimino-5-aminoimidazole carboxamide ribotide isomerase